MSTRAEEAASYRRLLTRLRARGTLEAFCSNLAALGLSSKSEPVVSDSLAAARTIEAKKGAIDFVFIDADHSYEACKADILAWAPFVKRGGILAFHDFGSRADGVTRAIFEETKAGRFGGIVGVEGTIIAFRM